MSKVSSSTQPCKRCGRQVRWCRAHDGDESEAKPCPVEAAPMVVIEGKTGRRIKLYQPHHCNQERED